MMKSEITMRPVRSFDGRRRCKSGKAKPDETLRQKDPAPTKLWKIHPALAGRYRRWKFST